MIIIKKHASLTDKIINDENNFSVIVCVKDIIIKKTIRFQTFPLFKKGKKVLHLKRKRES